MKKLKRNKSMRLFEVSSTKGIQEDPRHYHVTLRWGGRDLLGTVVGYENIQGPFGIETVLDVRHFMCPKCCNYAYHAQQAAVVTGKRVHHPACSYVRRSP